MSYQSNNTGAQVDTSVDKVKDYSLCAAYQTDAQRQQIVTVGTDSWQKADIPLTDSGCAGKLSLNTIDGRIEHTGETTEYLFNGVSTIDTPGNNMNVFYRIYINGTDGQEQTTSKVSVTIPNGAAVLNAASKITLNDGDYIEVWVKTSVLNGAFYTNNTQLQLAEVVRPNG